MIRDALASPIVRSRVSSGIGQQMIKKAVVTFSTELMAGNTEEPLWERLQEAIAHQLVSLGTTWYQLVSVGTAGYQLVSLGTARYQLVSLGTAWYHLVSLGCGIVFTGTALPRPAVEKM